MSDDACMWCGEPSTALCDYWLGEIPDPEDGLRNVDCERFTCDAPLCDDHRAAIGHLCSRQIKNCDTMDYCPAHKGMPQLTWQVAAKNREAARQMRHQVFVAANRSRMRMVSP